MWKILAVSSVLFLAGCTYLENSREREREHFREQFSSIPVSTCVDLDERDAPFREAALRECIDRQARYINKIYVYQLRTYDRALQGTLIVNMSILPDGELRSAYSTEKTTIGADFSGMVVEYLKKVTYPRSRAGWQGEYTLHFFPH